jgi:hypothetical protein
MTSKPCIFCNTNLDGWVYDFETSNATLGSNFALIDYTSAYLCRTCGAAVCAFKHNKEMKATVFSGLNKVICPSCGGQFGPPDTVSIREASNIVAKDKPSALTNLYPWAGIFLDSQNGEVLLAVDQPELHGDNDFRLLLTDRRFIFLPPTNRTVTSVGAFSDPDTYCTVIPLRSIATVEISKRFGGGTVMTVKTKGGHVYTLKSKIPFDNFGRHIQDAILNAPSALTFPGGEEVYFDGSSNFDILSPRDFLSKTTEFHAKRFHKSYLISLAVTNRRILFYRFNHIGVATGSTYTTKVQFGMPQLQFISIPWGNIRRIVVDKSFLSAGVNIILDTPVSGWMTSSLTVYDPNEEQMLDEVPYLKEQQNITPPIGVTGQEWSLPITTNIKAWESQILPSLQQVSLPLPIEEKGKKK